MKINGKDTEGNVDQDDARVGWKYPLNSKQIAKPVKTSSRSAE